MQLESIPQFNQNAFEQQLDVVSNIEMDKFRPEVRSYLENLITQARGILKTYGGDLGSARIEDLQQLKSLIEKIKYVKDKKEIPLGDYLFSVSHAINPYYEVFKQNDIPDRKEITYEVNLRDVLESDRNFYLDSGLSEWADALPASIDQMELDSKSREIIEERLKQGAIPIFMPGAKVQRETLLKGLQNLKPTWIRDGELQAVEETFIDDRLKSLITFQDTALVNNVPDEPYIMLVRPSQKLPTGTTSQSQDEQLKKLAEFQKDDQYFQSILPQEYASLQALFTSRARLIFDQQNKEIATLEPLDYNIHTRFITMLPTAFNSGPVGAWHPGGQLRFDYSSVGHKVSDIGFRVCVRVPVKVRR